MTLLAIAWRNLLRNRRRSLATLAAMVLGVTAILMFGGYRQSIAYGLETAYVQRSGHLQIQHRDYFTYGSGNPVAYGIADYEALARKVQQDPLAGPLVRVVTPVLQLTGIAANFGRGVSRTAVVVGVETDGQNHMRAWNAHGTAAEVRALGLTGSAPDAVVLGAGLARTLQLCGPLRVTGCIDTAPPVRSGDQAPDDISALSAAEQGATARRPTQIELLVANPEGAPNVASLQAIKAEEMGAKEIDDIFVSMHLAQAQRLLYGQAPARVTALQVQLHRTEDMALVQARLEALLKEDPAGASLAVLDFRTLNPSYGQINAMFGAVFAAVSVLVAVIVLFTVSNTMSMVVMERTTEIGTLRAIGQRRTGIKAMFLFEGALLGLVSAAIGLAVALSLAWLINHSGLSWTPPGRIDAVRITVRLWGELRLLMTGAVGIALVAALSAWLPARRGAHMNVVDALRQV
ncbi:ABC transporter permease [Ideonella sp. 4Y11]|uniref:ABC transporter permease n=1 Tax=Ideonella aquatica TaxID=2824119 RepID=A0A940YGY2_9BURK|nr:FtsX-like permease family protein [Ideonella aquatica]MBQ0957966.1 ABC transporter permease [Ideonella aquatica]